MSHLISLSLFGATRLFIFTVIRGLEAVGEAVEAVLGDPQGSVQWTEVHIGTSRDQLGEVNKPNKEEKIVVQFLYLFYLAEGPCCPPW